MKKKYSPGFERDWDFYVRNADIFTFSGTAEAELSNRPIADVNGLPAKAVFHKIESTGKNHPTCEPDLLAKVLMCKASINFHIKMWAEGMAEQTLFPAEFYVNTPTLHWEIEEKNGVREPMPIYKGNMKDTYGLPDWVIKATVKQALSLIRRNPNVINMGLQL